MEKLPNPFRQSHTNSISFKNIFKKKTSYRWQVSGFFFFQYEREIKF